MPKRVSSTHGWLRVALDLARKGKLEEAQRTLGKVAGRTLSADNLRTAAQVHRRCDRLNEAEGCWREIERLGEMEPGDYYMLGSLQMQLSQPEMAAQSFEREIAAADTTGMKYYLDSARLRLADLMLRRGDLSRAKDVVTPVDDSASDYVDGVGVRTKAAILREIESRSS